MRHGRERSPRGQGGVVSRMPAVRRSGSPAAQVRAQVRARRWRRVGRHSLVGRTPDRSRAPGSTGRRSSRAVRERSSTALSALEAAGLKHFDEPRIRVSRCREAPSVRRTRGLDIRQTRRWARRRRGRRRGTSQPAGRRRGPGSALGPRRDRQAALVMTMTVQQGLAGARGARPRAVRESVATSAGCSLHAVRARPARRRSVPRRARRSRASCRRRGIPEPNRQVAPPTDARSATYLDVVLGRSGAWSSRSTGSSTRGPRPGRRRRPAAERRSPSVATVVLRLPLLGLRVARRTTFFDQIDQRPAARRLAARRPDAATRHTKRSLSQLRMTLRSPRRRSR